MRGKVVGVLTCAVAGRITPAYAGKSQFRALFASQVQDHPRVCGEKLLICANGGRNPGSPPRMRGKAAHLCEWWPQSGITPAYAGKSTTESQNGIPS